MKKLTLLLLALMLFTLSGCEKSGGGGDFTYYLSTGVKSLDPQSTTGETEAIAINAIFEGLCRLDSNGNPIPGAAESWTSDPAFTRYTFTLRENSQWSDGSPLVAEDFVFAFRRAAAPETKSSNLEDIFTIKNAKAINEGKLDQQELGASAPDNRTLVVELEHSEENFPQMTAGTRFMPCQREFFASTAGRYGLEKKYLLTNGPFILSSSSDWAKLLTLPRSEAYRGEHPVRPDSLSLSIDMAAELSADPVTALLNGEADLLPLSYENALAGADQGLNVVALKNRVTGLVFNTEDEALKHTELRRLFIKSINRGEILSSLPESYEPTDYLVPDNVQWQDMSYKDATGGKNSLIAQDDGAASSLEDLLNSLDLEYVPPITVICEDDELSVSIANKLIVSWNGKMGNYFNIEPLSPDEFSGRMESGDYQAALCDLAAQGDTAYSFFKLFESTGSPKLLTSSQYDALLHKGSKSLQDYMDMEKILLADAVFYPIHKEKSYFGLSPKIKNLTISTGYFDFLSAEK